MDYKELVNEVRKGNLTTLIYRFPQASHPGESGQRGLSYRRACYLLFIIQYILQPVIYLF